MSHIEHTQDLLKIAIIGRPNVGKSSLFNKFLKERKAIIESVSGITRDRLYAQIELLGRDCILIDTGGLMSKPTERIDKLVYEQSKEAIKEADAVIFVCDLKNGLTQQDEYIGDILKKTKEKTFLVVNKVDTDREESYAFDFCKLGFSNPHFVSTLHKRGLKELYLDVAVFIDQYNQTKSLASKFKDQKPEDVVRISIVGKPNVGKSSLINCILNKERVLVDDVPGTTRDAIDISIMKDKKLYILVDTAGMRHKRKFKETVEIFSLSRTKESIKRSDVVIVMIDASIGLQREDLAVLDYVIKEGRSCILLINKWDLIEAPDADVYKGDLIHKFRPIEWIPMLLTSCIQKKNIIKALELAYKTKIRSQVILKTPLINKLIKHIQATHPHPRVNKAQPKIYYATQLKASPLVFVLFCNKPKVFKSEYVRYIERCFRKEFGLEGIPISFQLRPRGKR